MEGCGALDTLLRGVALLGRDGVERLIWVLLVFGPLFESISGFGLAIVIVIPMLRALGYSPLQTMALSMISQLAVPWGARQRRDDPAAARPVPPFGRHRRTRRSEPHRPPQVRSRPRQCRPGQ